MCTSDPNVRSLHAARFPKYLNAKHRLLSRPVIQPSSINLSISKRNMNVRGRYFWGDVTSSSGVSDFGCRCVKMNRTVVVIIALDCPTELCCVSFP